MADELKVISDCKEVSQPCVAMDLDTKNQKVIAKRTPFLETTTGGQLEHTLFEIKARGKLKDGKSATEHVLVFKGFTDGLECTAFGQGTVAVIGFSPSYSPIVLTNKGPLLITNKDLFVGSQNVQIMNLKNKTVKTFTSKSWDTDLSTIEGLNFDVQGNFLINESGKCIKISATSLFSRIKADACLSKKRVVEKPTQKYGGISLKSEQQIFEKDGTDYILILSKGSCS